MEDETLFKETLDYFGIEVYTEGFTPEQIFYQLEMKLGPRFTTLEQKITSRCKQEKKEENQSTEEDIETEENTIATEESTELEEVSEGGQPSDGLEAESSEYDTEESVEIESELWEDDESDKELINMPACEVMKILRNKK